MAQQRELYCSVYSFFGAPCVVLRVFMLLWRMYKRQPGWLRRVLWKLRWKGQWLFSYFWTCANSLANALYTSPFQGLLPEGKGQKRAELVPKGGVSGRCEDFKIIKACSNQQSPQLSNSCLPCFLLKPALQVFLAPETKRTHICVSHHLIFLPVKPITGDSQLLNLESLNNSSFSLSSHQLW